MMQTDFIVSLSDLRYIEIHCSCGTKVTLDMQEPSAFSRKQEVFAPKECPGCRNGYDSAIRPAVDSFQRAYIALLAVPKSITFRGTSSLEAV